jgi:hypothetical protein
VEREAFNQSKTYPSTRIPSRSNFRSYPLISDSSLLARADLPLHPPISVSASSSIEALDNVVEFIASMEFRRKSLPFTVTFSYFLYPNLEITTKHDPNRFFPFSLPLRSLFPFGGWGKGKKWDSHYLFKRSLIRLSDRSFLR